MKALTLEGNLVHQVKFSKVTFNWERLVEEIISSKKEANLTKYLHEG